MSRTTRHKDDSGKWFGANTIGRDKKPANKPNSNFKNQRRSKTRAEINQAFRNGKDISQFEKVHRNDVWDWN